MTYWRQNLTFTVRTYWRQSDQTYGRQFSGSDELATVLSDVLATVFFVKEGKHLWGELVKSLWNLGRKYLEGSEGDQEKGKEQRGSKGIGLQQWEGKRKKLLSLSRKKTLAPTRRNFYFLTLTDTIEVWKMLILHRIAKCDLRDTHSVTKCHYKCVFQVPQIASLTLS